MGGVHCGGGRGVESTLVSLGLVVDTNHVRAHSVKGNAGGDGDFLLLPITKLFRGHDEAKPQRIRRRGAQVLNGGQQADIIHRMGTREGHLVRALAWPNRIDRRLRWVYELHEVCGVRW